MKEIYILGTPSAEDSITAISYHKKKPGDITKVARGYAGPVSYETAISATGFGKFNIFLLLITVPSPLGSTFVSTAISMMLSESQCDLNLSLEDKGMLNAITYIGMISSAFLWGMVGDNYGRRTVLLYAHSIDGITALIGSFSTQKWMLLLTKYISGFAMSGPIAVYMSYVSEFHCTSFRPKIITILGVNYGLARTMLPLLAWWIMPLKIHFVIIEGIMEYRSWQLYLTLCSIPSLIAGVVFYFLPETPKFLMTKGRYDEAMELFRHIYVKNTGNPPESLPFSELTDVTYEQSDKDEPADHEKKSTFLLALYKQVKPLFLPPYLHKTFLMCGILFGGLLGGNTWRLWLPQLFTKMDEYVQTHNDTADATLCDMLDYSPKITNETEIFNGSTECTVPEVTDEVYINNTIVPVSSIVGYFVIAAVVSTIGKKTLLVLQFIVAGALVIGNYWAKNSLTTVVLSSLFLTFFSICATTTTSIAVELYPTNMRTMATSLFLLCGRIGSILGNTLFPILLYTGCLPPFLFIGGFMLLCAVFSLMLPGTENKPLK